VPWSANCSTPPTRSRPAWAQVAPRYRASARNFAHYVSVRQHDLRALQLGLLGHGLSSLGRLEGHVVDAIAQVRQRLDDALAAPRHGAGEDLADHAPSWDQAQRLLHAHTQALLGPRPAGRHVYVMVTAPSSDEVDDGWCGRLLDAGMNLLRINAAHEDEAAWTRIVTTARATAAARQVPLRIAVDLPGPKLRTVMLTAGPRVVKWKPAKDALGRVVAPRMIALHSAAVGAATADGLAVPTSIWATLAAGDQLTVRDARGKRRVVRVLERGDANGRGEVDATTYVTPGAQVCVTRVDRVYAEFGVVLKIETRRAFENLPSLLLAALRGRRRRHDRARRPGGGVGYERLAEVQEEILWLCEAAHVPVIWATQVLETLAKTGRPSRAEVTDAAMGERAECVMLNKGAHITEAVRAR
jgi:pyruvate kinase